MVDLLIADVAVVGPGGVRERQDVECIGSSISAVSPSKGKRREGPGIVDGTGCFLAPGFIDLHIHGLHHHLADQSVEDYTSMSAILPRYGVTGYLPTIGPKPKGADARYLASMAAAQTRGAQTLGFHLEGPFLAIPGAFPEEVLGGADPERVRMLIDAAGPYRAIFSCSPDFEDIEGLLPLMGASNTPVFMTHTLADVEQTQRAIEAGVRHATHFYDVFPCPEERDPGVRPCGAVEAVLADDRVSVDMITDGEHVDPVALKMAYRCKGPDRMCVATDSNHGAGLPPGRYEGFGGTAVEFAYPGGPARLSADSHFPGALAGSGLTMDRGLRNAISLIGTDLAQAVLMCSTNPARVLGLSDRKGAVEPGYDADLVLLDQNLEVLRTWATGESVYTATSEEEEDRT
jgi:N-acetylglucosamine-6-phosphate deacetylase